MAEAPEVSTRLPRIDSTSTIGVHGLPTVAIPQPPSIYDTTNVQMSQPRKGPRRPKREKIKVRAPRLLRLHGARQRQPSTCYTDFAH